MKFKRSSLVASMVAAGWLAGTSMPANAMLLDLPDLPLILGVQTVPNIFIMMDDSGSMDWEVLVGNHWPACRYTEAFGNNCTGGRRNNTMIFIGEDGGLYNWYYYSDTSDNAYNDGCPEYGSGNIASTRDCADENVNVLDIDWRFGSSDLNLMAFNPSVDYQPWLGFPNSDFNNARSHAQPGTDGYTDIANLSPFEFSVWIDNHGYTGNNPNDDGSDQTNTPNGEVDLWDDHIRVRVNNGGISCRRISMNPTSSTDMGLSSTPVPAAACAPFINNQSPDQLRQNIANWYTYGRKRSYAAKGAVVNVLENSPGFRYGISLINNNDDLFVEMPAEDDNNFAAHNETIRDGLLDFDWGTNGTPLRRGLDLVGRYYQGGSVAGANRDSPIIQSCQKNFSLLFTDGFWNGGDPSGIGDEDGDGYSQRLADVGMRYYDTDLRTDLPNEVGTDLFDTNNRQHMVTYTIAFGLETGLVDTDGDGWPDPTLSESSPAWWETAPDPIRRVDDLWHTAFNAKGRFVASQRPEDVTSALQEVVQNIQQRSGTAAAGATNGGSLSTNSRLYQAKFFADDWHGEFLAFNVQSDGSLATSAAWDSGLILDAQSPGFFSTSRKVFTYNPTANQGTPFLFNSLSPDQQAIMDTNPDTGLNDGLGEERVLHLRGFNGDEGTLFREREHRLGDLVNSDPMFVGAPSFFFNFDNYADFASANASRQPVVYVGGNDGMLHAFNGQSGEELFAYVPNEVMPRLPRLTSPNYSHEFFVDGSPSYSDVQVGGTWTSVLAGGLRSGGQGIYALDVTEPNSFTASDVLWEFTDEDDPDLGYTFGRPTMARMQNGEWAVIVGNGFNNTTADANPSTNGEAALFILFINRGRDGWTAGDYVKIRTGAGTVLEPNGLGSPGAVDIDGDSKTDFIYAGDLRGNLWKFDVSGSSPGSWDVDFGGDPLFQARDDGGDIQPILERPGAVFHPTGGNNGVLVTFGTGKFLEGSDRTTVNQPTQSVYAIWDIDASPLINSNDHGFNRSQLAEIRFALNSGFRTIDDSSDIPVWFDNAGQPVDRGWFVDLPLNGERVVQPVLIRSNTLFFVTLIPNDDPCSAGGNGFLIGLDVRNGQVPTSPLFDINNDNDFDEADLLGNGNDIVPIGLEQGSIPNLPVVIFDRRSLCERNPSHPSCSAGGGGGGGGGPQPPFPPPLNAPRLCGGNDDRALLYTTQSNGSIIATTADAGSVQCGRQAWRQLR
ncbi:MAG: PilC/PilY family type IV pilus protein [Wenzhouxiangellaceae bacterium]